MRLLVDRIGLVGIGGMWFVGYGEGCRLSEEAESSVKVDFNG